MENCCNLLSKIRLVKSSTVINNKQYYIEHNINNIDKDDIKKCLEFLRYY